MEFSERYKADLVNALHNVDTVTVQRVIDCLRQARSHNRRIFVFGSEHGGTSGANFLADTLRQSAPFKGQRLRVLNLNAHVPPTVADLDEGSRDRLIYEELKTFAEPNDVLIGISGMRPAASLVKALEYATWINCRTVAITGSEDPRITSRASICLKVSGVHSATVEDAVISVCHLIGHSFVDSCGVPPSAARS